MPQFSWAKPFNRNSRSSPISNDGQQQHPDLPLPRQQQTVQRSASVHERHAQLLDNRRSIALFSALQNPSSTHPNTPSDSAPASATALSGDPLSHSSPRTPAISRSQTVIYRDNSDRIDPIYEPTAAGAQAPGTPTSPIWSPDSLIPGEQQQQETLPPSQDEDFTSMNSKTSSDSSSLAGPDKYSQQSRRAQARLNTEQNFREQRQGGALSALSPLPGAESGSSSFMSQFLNNDYRTAQPNTATQRSSSQNNSQTHLAIAPASDPSQQQYTPPDAIAQYQAHHGNRSTLQPTRTYQAASTSPANAAAPPLDADPMSLANTNGSAVAAKNSRGGLINRQSVHHTDLLSRESSAMGTQQGLPAYNAAVVPPVSQGSMFNSDSNQQQTQQPAQPDARRLTPQPLPTSEDMSEEEINQLIRDHKELREKYTKVKKYYFEKEDQVKQLQNSLAYQRISQSRTSLDDSEYTTRFNRLDGLIAQLAFSIRKSWRSLPPWLAGSVNRDAITVGKQEMTAVGRAFIANWLVKEVFEKHFHPDLEPGLSAQLKSVQMNIRKFTSPAQTVEDEDNLTTKVINWRLATLEGLQDVLRSPQCQTYRSNLTDQLNERLCAALAAHLQEPPPSDLEGGVRMIVELVVSIAIHLPLESRDVVVEYFSPGHAILADQMKVESGIPALAISHADEAGERTSIGSAPDEIETDTNHEQPVKKRALLSALTGGGTGNKLVRNSTAQQQQQQQQQPKTSAGASSSSLQRPESSAGKDESPKVRMAAGIGVAVRGRSVLVKAPIFST